MSFRALRSDKPTPTASLMMADKAVHPHGSGRSQWLQVEVDWDNGRKLMLSVPPDQFEVVHACAET